MAHQMGICGCGKKRHWPKNSVVGDTWKCYNCGRVTTLVAEGGKKTRTVKSKKPPKDVTSSSSPQSTHTNSSSSNNSCFPKGTNISTPTGTQDIASLRKGDFVISVDAQKNHHVNKILKVKKHTNKALWLLKFDDGSSLKTTCHHTFFSGNKWVKSKNLLFGNKVLCFEEGSIGLKTVSSSSEISLLDDVYNIYVENDFNFIAEGMVAHSFSNLRLVRSFLWSVYSFITNSKVRTTLINLQKI